MALSEWPENWDSDDGDDRNETVTVVFDTEMFVAVVTDKAVGLKEDEESSEIDIWLPLSQIKGPTLNRGDWIDTVEIPKWLADDKDLEYD